MIVLYQDLPFYRFTILNIPFNFFRRTTKLLIFLAPLNYIGK